MTTLIKNIELEFWNITIPLLTRSNLLRMAIQKTYKLYQEKPSTRQVALILMICCAGFATGMLAFSVSILLS